MTTLRRQLGGGGNELGRPAAEPGPTPAPPLRTTGQLRRGRKLRRDRGARCSHRHPDDGFAFLVAVVVIALIMVLVAGLVFSSAIDNVTTSARSVQQAQALQAAHAGLDMTYERISSLLSTEAPCGPTAVRGSIGSEPSSSTYTVSVTYYSTPTATATHELACTPTLKEGVRPESVLLTSVGTDLGRRITMVSLATLAVGTGSSSVLGDGVLVDSSLQLSGNVTFKFASSKNVYVNGTLTCTGNETLTAKIVVFGKLTASGQCKLEKTVEVTKTIHLTSNGGHGGNVFVGGVLESTGGSIQVTGNPAVPNTINARYTITYTQKKWTSHGKITAHTSSLVSPPPPSFPQVTWSATAWYHAGYQVTTYNTCTATGAAPSFYTKISAMSTAKQPLAIYTTCTLKNWPQKTFLLGQNLAIFSTGGFSITGNLHFGPAGTAKPDFYMIVPSTTSCTGTNGNIRIGGSASISPSLDTLIYTPCNVTLAGTSNLTEGEVYAGGKFAPAGTMGFGSAITVPGAIGGTASASPPAVGIVYEREQTP